MVVAERRLVFSHSVAPWTHMPFAAVGTAQAILRLGAWSVAAHLFGPKGIHIPQG
jgi:hypothetical protein